MEGVSFIKIVFMEGLTLINKLRSQTLQMLYGRFSDMLSGVDVNMISFGIALII